MSNSKDVTAGPVFPEQKHSSSTPCLVVVIGHDQGRIYELRADGVIGRKKDVDLPINGDESIAREHAVFEVRDGRVFVRDLKASHGTFVNDKRVTERELNQGDLILVGKTQLKFLSNGNVEEL